MSLGLNGAVASVVVITFDRYWKIVHSVHHRKYYRRWMLYIGLFLPWLNGSDLVTVSAEPGSKV